MASPAESPMRPIHLVIPTLAVIVAAGPATAFLHADFLCASR